MKEKLVLPKVHFQMDVGGNGWSDEGEANGITWTVDCGAQLKETGCHRAGLNLVVVVDHVTQADLIVFRNSNPKGLPWEALDIAEAILWSRLRGIALERGWEVELPE